MKSREEYIEQAEITLKPVNDFLIKWRWSPGESMPFNPVLLQLSLGLSTVYTELAKLVKSKDEVEVTFKGEYQSPNTLMIKTDE